MFNQRQNYKRKPPPDDIRRAALMTEARKPGKKKGSPAEAGNPLILLHILWGD